MSVCVDVDVGSGMRVDDVVIGICIESYVVSAGVDTDMHIKFALLTQE